MTCRGQLYVVVASESAGNSTDEEEEETLREHFLIWAKHRLVSAS